MQAIHYHADMNCATGFPYCMMEGPITYAWGFLTVQTSTKNMTMPKTNLLDDSSCKL